MAQESWNEIARTFRFVRASELLQLDALPPHQVLQTRGGIWFDDSEPPLLALFVSHRWETPHAPAGRDAEGRGFGRNMFFDGAALLESRELYVPAPPSVADATAATVVLEGYEQSRRAFENDLQRVRTSEALFVDVAPPDLWSSYCDLIVQGFHTLENDPNPVRAGLQFTQLLGESLLTTWLQATQPVELELRSMIERAFAAAGLSCSVPADTIYLGRLLAGRGKLRPFDALVQDALHRHLAAPSQDISPLRARLQPMPEELRRLVNHLERPSASSLHSLLTSGPTRASEREVV